MIHHMILGALLFLQLLSPSISTPPISLSATLSNFLEKEDEGTRWALLVAGSRGYENYRHQVPYITSFCLYTFLFGAEDGNIMLHTVRPGGKPLVDDWNCLKTFVRIYEEHCGALSKYGMKYV